MRNILFSLCLMMLVGCGAHRIIITPELQSLKKTEAGYIQATAGYYITPYDLGNYVYSPAGGGERVWYYPYKELEPALQKVLLNLFQDVKRLDLMITPEYLKANDISFAFLPEIKTDSDSDAIFTWMPTSFTVNLSCKAFSQNGILIWERKYTGVGTATFSELTDDVSLAAKRASQKVFSEMLNDLLKAKEFRN
jgi:hypothetical protein